MKRSAVTTRDTGQLWNVTVVTVNTPTNSPSNKYALYCFARSLPNTWQYEYTLSAGKGSNVYIGSHCITARALQRLCKL